MSASPTLFILSNMREIGGAEKSITTLIPHLADSAQLRIFVENARHEEDLRRLGHERIALTRLPGGNSPVAMLRGLLTIARFILRERPAAILANGHKGALMLALLRLLPLPRATCGIYLRDFGYSLLRLILRLVPDALYFAPTQAVFEDARYRSWGLDRARHRLIVMPNAVKLPRERALATSAGSEPFIGCCARLTPWKGIEYLLRAFGDVARTRPETRLRIYGEAVDREYLELLQRLTRELGIERAVKFESYTSNIGEVFATGLFFVVPSLSMAPGPETFSRIIIEAWAHEKPVIAFATGGPKYLIDDGTDGLLVEEKNVAALAQAMESLLASPARREAMGRHGFEKVRDRFDPATLAGELAAHLLPAQQQKMSPSHEPVAAVSR